MSYSECCCDVTAPPLSTNIYFLLINKSGQSLVSLAIRNARSVHQCSVAYIEFLSSEGDIIGMVQCSARCCTGPLHFVCGGGGRCKYTRPCPLSQPSPAQPQPSPAQHRGSRMTNEMEISGAAPRQFSDSTIRLLSDMEMRCRDEQLQR